MSNFGIEYCSFIDYDNVTIAITYKMVTVAMLTQENGPENIHIEIYPPENDKWEFSLNEFLEAIEFAKKELLKENITDEN